MGTGLLKTNFQKRWRDTLQNGIFSYLWIFFPHNLPVQVVQSRTIPCLELWTLGSYLFQCWIYFYKAQPRKAPVSTATNNSTSWIIKHKKTHTRTVTEIFIHLLMFIAPFNVYCILWRLLQPFKCLLYMLMFIASFNLYCNL